MSKLMIMTVPNNHSTGGNAEKANLIACRDAFGVPQDEMREALRRAYRGDDKVKVACTVAQFGTYIHRRCALGGQNLIQALEAHELPTDKAEPGIGYHGAVFFVADGGVRAERFSVGQAESRIHREHFVPEIHMLNYADIEKRCVARYRAGVGKHVSDAWDASAWTGHPPAKNDPADLVTQHEFIVPSDKPRRNPCGWPPSFPNWFSGQRAGKTAAMEALAAGYGMGQPKWKAWSGDVYVASAKQMEIQRFNGMAKIERDKQHDSERKAGGYRSEGLHTHMRGALRFAALHKGRAEKYEANARALIFEYGGRMPGEYTLDDLVAFQKDAVRRDDLEWHHVKAVERAFGVEHTSELKPEQYRCVYDALRAVILARASGMPVIKKLKETVEEQAKEIAVLRTKLHEAKVDLLNKPSAPGYFGLVKKMEEAEALAAQRGQLVLGLTESNGKLQSEITSLRHVIGGWERGFNWVKGLLEKSVPKENHDRIVAGLEAKLADRGRVQDYLNEEVRRLNARVVAAEQGPITIVSEQLQLARQAERDSIVAHMEQRSNELYRQSQDSSPSAGDKLRASCYSLRNHAQQICKRMF